MSITGSRRGSNVHTTVSLCSREERPTGPGVGPDRLRVPEGVRDLPFGDRLLFKTQPSLTLGTGGNSGTPLEGGSRPEEPDRSSDGPSTEGH